MLFTSHLHVMLTRIQIWNPNDHVCSDVRSTVAQQQLPLSLRSLLLFNRDTKANHWKKLEMLRGITPFRHLTKLIFLLSLWCRQPFEQNSYSPRTPPYLFFKYLSQKNYKKFKTFSFNEQLTNEMSFASDFGVHYGHISLRP